MSIETDGRFSGMRDPRSRRMMRRDRYWRARQHKRFIPNWETIVAMRSTNFAGPFNTVEELFEHLNNWIEPLWSKFGKMQDTDGLEIIRCRMIAIRQRPNRLKKVNNEFPEPIA